MKISDFLEGRRVERQAVLRYINRHSDAFEGHITKAGRELDLDQTALAILDEMYPMPVRYEVISDAQLASQLIQAKDELLQLRAEKSEWAAKEAEYKAAAQISMRSLADHQALIQAKDDLIKAKDELLQERDARIQDLQQQVERQRQHKSWWKRLIHD